MPLLSTLPPEYSKETMATSHTTLTGIGTFRSLPQAVLDHPSIKGRYYYLLPRFLIEDPKEGPKLPYRNPESVQLDRLLLDTYGDMGIVAGLFNGVPFNYSLLQITPKPIEIPADLAEEWRLQAPRFKVGIAQASDSLDRDTEATRSYVGWLLTNSDFLAERNELLRTWNRCIEVFGIPEPMVNDNAHILFTPTDEGKSNHAEHQAFAHGWKEFFLHWGLMGMAGPGLPIPVRSHGVLFGHGLSINDYRNASAGLSNPPTHSLPGAQELRSQLERSMSRPSGGPHLTKWYEIVENVNSQKAVSLKTFARRFQFSHYWTVFTDHYGPPPRGTLDQLLNVFRAHLDVSDETVRADYHAWRAAQRPPSP
jgi:hypothetical protein